MILKNLSRAAKPGASTQLISYVLRYAVNPEKQVDKKNHFVLTHNLRGNTVEEYARQYLANEANRLHKSSKQTAIHHTILAFNHVDSKVITDDMLRTIAKQFIKLRGEENLYLFAKHENTDSLHLHCTVSGSTIAGKSSRLSNKEFAKLKLELDLFQEKNWPQLSSLPRHGLAKQIAIGEIEQYFDGDIIRKTQKMVVGQIIEVGYKPPPIQEPAIEKLRPPLHIPYEKSGRFTELKLDEETSYRLSRTGFNEEIRDQINYEKEREEASLAELHSLRNRSCELDREAEHIRQVEDFGENAQQAIPDSEDNEWPFEHEPDMENED